MEMMQNEKRENEKREIPIVGLGNPFSLFLIREKIWRLYNNYKLLNVYITNIVYYVSKLSYNCIFYSWD